MPFVRRIQLDFDPLRLKFAPDGSRVLAISRERIASCHINGTVEYIAFQPLMILDADYVNNEQIVIASLPSPEPEFDVAVYDLKSQHITAQVRGSEERAGIRAVSVDQTRGRIFAGRLSGDMTDHDILIFDVALKQQSEFSIDNIYMPFDIALSHTGDRLAIAGVGFGVWDIAGEPERITEECPTNDDCTGTPCEVNSGTITPDGRFAAAGFHGAKGNCAVLNCETGKIIGWYGPRGSEMEYYATGALSLSPDGKYVAVGIQGSTKIRFYNVADRTVAYVYDAGEQVKVIYAPSGEMVALGGEHSITLYQFD